MRASRRLARGLVGLLSVPLAGCTFWGWLIGHQADKNAAPKTVPPLEVVRLDKGRGVELTLRDGSQVSGRFDGLEPIPQSQYRDRWKESLQALAPATLVPGLGAAQLRTKGGKESEVTLVGLLPGALRIRTGRSATVGAVTLDSVATLGVPGGGSIDGATLARLAQEGRLPFLDGVALKAKDGTRQVVPLESVRSGSFKHGHGALIGALTGLAIDGLIVGLAIHSEEHMFDDVCKQPNSCTSCPTVYSPGGDGWRLEAEPLGGSLFAADEATDRALLARVAPRGGAYRVEVRNEMREVEHLDRVRLLVVDHAPGVEIVPAMSGALFAVGPGVAPSRAVDETGANLAPLLANADGHEWVEVPVGRDPDDPASRRATALIEFPRLPGAGTGVLDLTLRSTEWGMALLGNVFGLQGRELEAFWGRLEADAERRHALRRAWAREALPRIQVFARDGWRDAGTLSHVPTLVNGRRAVPIDLRDVDGTTLRVRIDTMPGLWLFDRVAVDYAARPAPEARVLGPASARTPDGADVRSLLADSDDRRLTLAARSGRVDLAFDAPALAPGSARSVLIEMEGYYRPLVAASGEPQRELFDRLVDEPGALTRYVLAGAEASTQRLERLASAGHAVAR